MRTKTKKTKQITQIVVSMLLVLTMVFMPMKMILAADAQSSSTPTQFVLVLDCSGSMEESDVNGLSPKAAKMFVDMMPVENAQIAVVAFGANWGEDSYVYPGDTTSNTYTKVTDNVDEYLGDILEQFGSSISEITGGSGGSAKDIVASMKLTPKKYMLDKKDGSVKCKAEFEVNGMKTTKMLKISVVKKNDEWYISGISVIAE